MKISAQGNRYTLNIREASLADQGKYEVVGLNSAGEARCECEVVITEPISLAKAKPSETTISKGLEPSTSVDEGQSSSLSVLVAGLGELDTLDFCCVGCQGSYFHFCLYRKRHGEMDKEREASDSE